MSSFETQQLVPYSMNTDMVPLSPNVEPLPEKCQVIHFTLVDAMLLDKIQRWFAERDEVMLVDHGTTGSGLGFVVMEREEYTIDPLFIAFLEHEDFIDDYSIYTRDWEG
ncbi:MAG: hypothetical protein NVSMB38_28910 [Ktedonobacteraceae bacterium]